MKKYLEYKNEIQGLDDVLKTIKATEKIAASYTGLLKKESKNLEIYKASLDDILSRLLIYFDQVKHPFLTEKKEGKNLLIIITGDKGLVGNLYHNIINTYLKQKNDYQIVASVGKKGFSYLNEEKIETVGSFSFSGEIPQQEEIKNITEYIFSEFQRDDVKTIDILYGKFISLSEQQPTITNLLPFKFETNEENIDKGFPIFEPSKQENFDRLIKKYIEVFSYKIIIEAKLSEISARTIDTEHSSEKIKRTITNLKIEYSKTRRGDITQRQIENFINAKY